MKQFNMKEDTYLIRISFFFKNNTQMVKLYDKLKNMNEVQDIKEFMDLIHIRAIRINDLPVDDPRYELEEKDRIQVGIKLLED